MDSERAREGEGERGRRKRRTEEEEEKHEQRRKKKEKKRKRRRKKKEEEEGERERGREKRRGRKESRREGPEADPSTPMLKGGGEEPPESKTRTLEGDGLREMQALGTAGLRESVSRSSPSVCPEPRTGEGRGREGGRSRADWRAPWVCGGGGADPGPGLLQAWPSRAQPSPAGVGAGGSCSDRVKDSPSCPMTHQGRAVGVGWG